MSDGHVEPVRSLTPPRRGGRWRTIVAVVAPVAILAGVVGGGVLGRLDDGRVAPPPGPSLAVGPGPSAEPPSSPGQTNRPVAADFPRDALGLRVESVEATLRALRDDALPGRVAAVAGWLSVPPRGDDCRDEYDRGIGPTTLCSRDAILGDSPEPILGVEDGELVRLRPPGAHLHPVALPGVFLRGVTTRQFRGGDRTLRPTNVIVVGRFGEPRLPECRPEGRHCGETFSLERIVWIDGEWQDRRAVMTTPQVEGADPSPLTRRGRIAGAVPGTLDVMTEILVPRDALAGVHREADRAVPARFDGPVWYVRFLVGHDEPRDVGWAVLDDASGEVVASDPGEPGIETAFPYPARVLGIDTIDAEAALVLAGAAPDPDRLVAVTGWLSLAPEPPDCRRDRPALCRRPGILSDRPTPGRDALYLETRPDVTVLGAVREPARPAAWSLPSRAVVIGRFATWIDRECGLQRPSCAPVFAIDQVTWMEDAGLAGQPVATPTSPSARTRIEAIDIARGALPGAGEVLGSAFLDRSDLAGLEPAAAGLAPIGDGSVWLVRLVVPHPDGNGAVAGWAVIDDATGAVLAATPEPAAP